MISIILTSQKFNLVPTAIRSNLNIFITFKLHKLDWKIFDDNLYCHESDLNDIINFVFKELDDFLIYRLDTNEIFKRFDKIIL